MPRGFDHYMVARGAASDVKLRRLSLPERHAFFLGVLSIAAGASPRGRLLIADGVEATAEDVAHEANVPVAAARSALQKLESVGVLVRDDLPGLLVRRWGDHQREPRSSKPSDAPEETRDRQRESRAAKAASNAVASRVTKPVRSRGHDGEEKRREEEHPPTPFEGELPAVPVKPTSRRQRDREQFEAEVAAYAATGFPDLPEEQRVGLVRSALGRPGTATHDSIRAWVERWTSAAVDDEAHAAAVLPEASELGARVVDLNARAEAAS